MVMRMLVMLAPSVSGGIAQWVEHSTADREVPGSNLGAPYFFFSISVQLKLCGDADVASVPDRFCSN